MFKKIHFGYALYIIFIVSTIPIAFLLSALFSTMEARQVNAFALANIGIEVLSPPLKCVQDGPSPKCSNCTVCGNLAGVCNGIFEVKARYLSGINLLIKGAGEEALCLTNPVTPKGKTFNPTSRCLGKIFFLGPLHALFNFNCGGI